MITITSMRGGPIACDMVCSYYIAIALISCIPCSYGCHPLGECLGWSPDFWDQLLQTTVFREHKCSCQVFSYYKVLMLNCYMLFMHSILRSFCVLAVLSL